MRQGVAQPFPPTERAPPLRTLPMPNDDTISLWSALLTRARASAAVGPFDPTPLRDYVRAFIRGTAARGDSPEQALRALQRDTTPGIRAHLMSGDERVLLAAVLQWGFDEYNRVCGPTHDDASNRATRDGAAG
jgi:hypothetical protein